MRLRLLIVITVVAAVLPAMANADETLLLQRPTVSADHVAFVYANDLWVAPISGGEARRLTTHEGAENAPLFSPDGKWIAFSGQYDGNQDIYLLPVEGGDPKRLTYHPEGEAVRGWTNDGSAILFASSRDNAPIGLPRLWTVGLDGSMPERLPMPAGNRGSYSPDGSKLAYVELAEAYNAWRHYRGGRQTYIRIIDMESYESELIPRTEGNDSYPMWIGGKIYFISDRQGTMNLFSYDTLSKEIEKLTDHTEFDIKNASANGGMIAYEQAGRIHLFDTATGESTTLSISVKGDLPWRRPHFAKVGNQIRSYNLSPTGVRAVVGARGDIFTLPAKKGDYRNLSTSPGVHDRYPAWSPDGKWVAWFSDEGGEYGIVIRDQLGREEPRRIEFENPSFYYDLQWSPDSGKLLFYDKHLNVWYLDVESGEATLVDTDTYDHPVRTLDPRWSPDSKWITYSKRLDNHMHAIFLYSLETGTASAITDGLSDSISPAFDKSGKYLYFLASTNYGLNTGWLDMSSYERPVRRGVYLVVLDSELESPFLPESDEEKVKPAEPAAEKDDTAEEKGEAEEDEGITIDLDGIGQRILAVDVPERDYQSLAAADEGVFFYTEAISNEQGLTLHRYSLNDRESKTFMSGISGMVVSADGKKLLYSARGSYGIVATAGKAKPGEGRIDTNSLEMKIEPQAEWKQVYHEAWRINRDYFYDEEMHGADWPAIYKKYEPFLEHIGHRADLNYIIASMIGELVVGHAYNGGGDGPRAESVPVGMLGADYTQKDGYYSFERIYDGENWNPGLRAPLTAPGVNIKEGDYLLAVNGVALTAEDNIYQFFHATAGKQITITVNDSPSLEGARVVTVVPVNNERGLRARFWIEENRRRVDELSDGKLAYVYLPNTAGAGYTNFNRYYFTQMDKQGAILDERFNGGGSAADYIVDYLDRKLLNYWATRDGKNFFTPTAALFGPKVMIINEWAGSGGDAMPFYFRKRGIGPLVGKTTWGGLVGIYDYPVLMDGGMVTAPRVAFYNEEGEWDVENEGVAPDIEIGQDPKLVIEGHDPQLEKAVEVALELLKENPVEHTPRPEPIKRVK